MANLIDRAVEFVAPRAGLARSEARQALARSRQPDVKRTLQSETLELIKRAFEGAKFDRTNKNWLPNSQSIDLQVMADGKRLRDRARDLIQNNGFARSAQSAIVANTLGTGIRPLPKIANREQKKLWRDEWCRWCDEADITGHQHYYELVALALKETIQTGEVLVKNVFYTPQEMRRFGRRFHFGMQLIEAERLLDNQEFFGPEGVNPKNGNQVRNGVEIEQKFGSAVAYYILPHHPNDMFATALTPDRVDAQWINHSFVRERIGQHRGVTWLAAAIQWLFKLGAYTENEMVASTLAACQMLAIKTLDGTDTIGLTGSDATDDNGNKLDRFEPGMVAKLAVGESVEQVMPNRPNTAAEAWTSLMLRSIGVSMDLGYETISRDHSKTNYSGGRTEELESRRRYGQIISFLIHGTLKPTWELFVRQNVLRGTQGFPSIEQFSADPEPWLNCDWIGNGREWVDPVKEQAADDAAIAGNQKTLAKVCAEHDEDWEDVLDQRAVENDRMRLLGLPIPQPKPLATMGQPDGNAQAG